MDRLTLNASAGYYTYDSEISDPTISGYVHSSVREQPELSYAVGAQYSFRLPGGGASTPRIDAFYQGERTNGVVGTPQLDPCHIVPDRTIANARLTYTPGDSKWSAALSAENVLDKFYWAQLTAERDPAGLVETFDQTGVPGRGRECVLSLRRTF